MYRVWMQARRNDRVRVPMTRPEQKTRKLPNGETVHEAGDCEFVSSPNGTVHRRDPSDSEEYDYEYHPGCGQHLPEGSMWSRVDAEDPEEAVMKYNLRPCQRCIEDSYRLNRWRKAAHMPVVMNSVELPEEWK